MISSLSATDPDLEIALRLATDARRKAVCASFCQLVAAEQGVDTIADVKDGVLLVTLDRTAPADLAERLDQLSESFQREYWEKRNAWEQSGEGIFNSYESLNRKHCAIKTIAIAARGMTLPNVLGAVSVMLGATNDDDKLVKDIHKALR